MCVYSYMFVFNVTGVSVLVCAVTAVISMEATLLASTDGEKLYFIYSLVCAYCNRTFHSLVLT